MFWARITTAGLHGTPLYFGPLLDATPGRGDDRNPLIDVRLAAQGVAARRAVVDLAGFDAGTYQRWAGVQPGDLEQVRRLLARR
ncbi:MULTISPECIES: hypothetical protein [unclassified Parafrankia]|uniref:hypothetical protein n=1 Tax=unclassified Parafrankia TaxID=2994368 RepID=UPI000DA42652|nr:MULTISPECIES: hypothetical protein [unclassified Parafrankia]TCJ30711.1 hypothetical protein E0504_49650 [Parafrankia sp. BMG5.11]SQD97349.1 hypothetical protein FMEAI12_4020078 [Parafrankia sp. Ea1.12]